MGAVGLLDSELAGVEGAGALAGLVSDDELVVVEASAGLASTGFLSGTADGIVADSDELRLSVIYQPVPLNTMPTG